MIERDGPHPAERDTHESEGEPPKSRRQKLLKIAETIDVPIDRPEPDVLAACTLVKRGSGDSERYVPGNTALNVYTVLAEDTRWRDHIRTNEFDGTVYVTLPGDAVPEQISGVITTIVVQWLERVYDLRTTEDRVGKAINVIGDENGWHPLRNRLEALKWDGVARMDSLLPSYFGAEDKPLTRALGACWMISAVARVMRPGCKVDTMLILVGKQGARKSTACRVLAFEPDYYSDTPLDLRSKDLYESIHGVWLYEIAEVDSFRKAEWPRVKAAVSSAHDRYRRPYGIGAERRMRQCVFLGTTNEDQFLGDPTGSRRFWPVRVSKSNIRALMADRDQLWAEAVARYRKGEKWWLDDALEAELREESEQYQMRHPWEEPICEWLAANPGPASVSRILQSALNKTKDSWNRSDEMTVGDILRGIGYSRVRIRTSSGRRYAYTKDKTTP